MNLIQELENQFKIKSKTGTIQEKEKIAVDFLSHIDFKDEDTKAQALQYVSQKLNDVGEKNQPLTSVEAKSIHCMITKMTLDELNLSDIKIIYRDKTSHDKNGAYYSDEDKSITFYNQNVCDSAWLNPTQLGGDKNREGYQKQCGGYRLSTCFLPELQKQFHEIRHAVQFKELEENEHNMKQITPESYTTSKQIVARTFARGVETGKYYSKDLNRDRLYDDNHDNFYYEIDAHKDGYEKALAFCKNYCPYAYDIAIDEKRGNYLSHIKSQTDLLNKYSFVTWKHNTNPEQMEVNANHKASMIIDNILPQLNGNQRKEFMDKYPALSITYNPNGSLKTLEQVEREKQAKINNLLINGTDKEIQEKAANISKVYDTAIESHPVLCFEKCLQHMARLSWNSDRYFTDSGIEVKYNPSEVRKELQMAQAKAKAIASYMEDTDAKQLKAIFERYKRELMASPKLDQTSVRFFEDKKLAIYSIESQIYRNKEVKSVIEKDSKDAVQKRIQKQMQKAEAEEILKKVFPNFIPAPQKGIIQDGNIVLSDNVSEKLMMMEAYKEYVKTVTSGNMIIQQDNNVVPSSKLLSAIRIIYGFNPSISDINKFQKDLKSGDVKIIQNKYQQENYTTGTYTEEEKAQTKVETKIPDWSKPAEKEEPKSSDPEADGTKARYESQRQAQAAQHQAQIEEEKVRPVTKEEIETTIEENSEFDYMRQQQEQYKEQLKREAEERQRQEQESKYVDEYGVERKRTDEQKTENQTTETYTDKYGVERRRLNVQELQEMQQQGMSRGR